jgi:6-phosphofructokinase 2
LLLGSEIINVKSVIPVAREIISKGQAEVIVVSLGDLGAVLVTINESYHIIPPQVKKKSTVGAGDSMVAGIVLSLARKKTLKEVLQFGVACGTAAVMNPGTELCRKKDAERLFEELNNLETAHLHS